jgi:hypothetical protein
VLVSRAALVQRVTRTFLIKHAVRQLRQSVVMGHMRDPGLGLAPLGDINDGNEKPIATIERHPPSECQHLDLAAIGFQVPPVAIGMVGIADLPQRLGMDFMLILRPDIPDFFA